MQETNDPISVPCGSVTLLKGAELVCKRRAGERTTEQLWKKDTENT